MNTLLYKNINLSHFIFERVMFVVCEKLMETRTDCYIYPSSSLNYSSSSFTSWLGLLNRGSLRAQSPQSASWFSLWHPVSNWLEPPRHLVILFSNAHLLLLFFRLFTQVHLLIDSSVKGQYITFTFIWRKKWFHAFPKSISQVDFLTDQLRKLVFLPFSKHFVFLFFFPL